MKPKSWLVISVVVVLMIGVGNLIGYWFFSRARDMPVHIESTVDAETTARTLALDRRTKALEALRVEDYDTAIANLEAAQQLDPTLVEIPKFIEVAKKLKASRTEVQEMKAELAEAPVEQPKELKPVVEAPKQQKAEPVRESRAKPRERTRETQTKPEPTGPGVLIVTTSPTKLLVEIDGKARDLTPARIELSAGTHSVRIIDGERALFAKEIDLDHGEVLALNESFGSLPATPEKRELAAANTAESLEGDGKLDLVRLIDRDASREAARDTKDTKKEITQPKELAATENKSGLTPAPNNTPPRVLVFLPGKASGNFERSLSSRMSGIEVRVVTRASDLKEMTKSGPVDAILASPGVLRQYGLRPQLSGVSAKETRYVAASFKAGLTKEQLANLTIAAVDELGKKETAEMVARLLGTTKKVKLRRVTKLEDLVPSMQVKLADAILVRDSDLAEIKNKTQQQLHLVELSERVDPLAVGFVDGGRRSVVERAVLGLDEQMRADLGVARWSP
jgi:hypothetical protein